MLYSTSTNCRLASLILIQFQLNPFQHSSVKYARAHRVFPSLEYLAFEHTTHKCAPFNFSVPSFVLSLTFSATGAPAPDNHL